MYAILYPQNIEKRRKEGRGIKICVTARRLTAGIRLRYTSNSASILLFYDETLGSIKSPQYRKALTRWRKNKGAYLGGYHLEEVRTNEK